MEHTPQENGPDLKKLLNNIARRPVPADLWALRGAIYSCANSDEDTELISFVVKEFYTYLSEIKAKISARHYNEMASRLDIASVGVLALQDILVERENLGLSLLLGSLGEGLMVLASRQYVRAWEQELKATHRHAAWVLFDVWWRLSLQYQPDMATYERRCLIEATIAPARSDDVPFEGRMLLLLRLFQIAVLLLAAPLCSDDG